MNIYLLQLAGKLISLIFIGVVSLFSDKPINNEETIKLTNSNLMKNEMVITEVQTYQTKHKNNYKIPRNKTSILVKGVDGITYVDKNNKIKTLVNKIDEVIEVGTGKQGEYTGVITAYGPDCKTCSGRGNVACRNKNGKKINIIKDGVYYQDEKYDKLRILAAPQQEFPCGTVVYVDDNKHEPFYGIVVDRGIALKRNYEKGIIHFDVAFPTENLKEVAAYTNFKGNVKYSVQRWGW